VVIGRPNNPIPMEATPIARRYGGSLEVGTSVTIKPNTRMAKPIIASEIHAVTNWTLAR